MIIFVFEVKLAPSEAVKFFMMRILDAAD